MADNKELIDALRKNDKPNERNKPLGYIADALRSVDSFARQPFGYQNPAAGYVSDLLGVPTVADTADKLSRGEPVGGWQAAETALAVSPLIGPAAKGIKAIGKVLPKNVPAGLSTEAVGGMDFLKPEYLYHGTSPEAAKAIDKSGFDLTKSADGTVWFTSNPNIGEVAASNKGAIIKRQLPKDIKLGGWDEMDKYSTDELLNMGYHGLKLPDGGEITYQIFNPEKLSK